MLAEVRTPHGATCNCVLQVEATFVSLPGLELRSLEYRPGALDVID